MNPLNGCDKRQKIVKRPSGETKLRCMNRACGMKGQEVDLEVCARCPVRSVPHVRPCNSRRTGEAMLPIVDVAKQRELADATHEEVKQLAAEAGMDVTGLEPAAVPDHEFPALTLQLWTYKEALLKWAKAGRPTRSDEEVEHIHETHCKPCEWYDPEQSRCKGCGCKVTVGSIAVFNKLRMATEHCPKEKF